LWSATEIRAKNVALVRAVCEPGTNADAAGRFVPMEAVIQMGLATELVGSASLIFRNVAR